MSVTNPFTESRSGSVTVSNVDTDANGQVVITLGELREIDSVADVNASASGGYVVNPVSVSDNQVTVEVRASAGTAGNPLPLVTGTADVTDVHVRAEGY